MKEKYSKIQKYSYHFLCLADYYSDLVHVSSTHIQIRLIGNVSPNDGVVGHVGTDGSLCLICKQGTENVTPVAIWLLLL